MASDLAAPPVFSTPDDHILELPAPARLPASTLSNDALRSTYEIGRTTSEIKNGKWDRIALQFPDHMLVDAPRVAQILRQELSAGNDGQTTKRVHILADTSYSACCVDEVAAEHANAEVVVHYGRTCLSPTSRLPVVYVYTIHQLDDALAVHKFKSEFKDLESKVIIMADITYQDHVEVVVSALTAEGYTNVIGTEVKRDPTGKIPNRRILGFALEDSEIASYSLFHISEPPSSLLLALQSRFASLYVLPTSTGTTATTVQNPSMQTAGLLRRRFARVLSLSSAGVIGILVNTLSVSNYLSSVNLLRELIAKAGKKSYTVVVGKLNPAKLANFGEIEGWVIVGCWESGLIEDDVGYWRPVVTPFELEVALMPEDQRIWGSSWWGGIEKLNLDNVERFPGQNETETKSIGDDVPQEDDVDGDESLPPIYDLRTGKLVSHSRPMRLTVRSAEANKDTTLGSDGQGSPDQKSNTITRRVAGELASINGVASPGADFLRSKRTWQGLGSDFDQDASTAIQEGRTGIARGYHVGDEKDSLGRH